MARHPIERNGLSDGDYRTAPNRHRSGYPLTMEEWPRVETVALDDVKISVAGGLLERCNRYEQASMMLAGDLRRLENDVVDEASICLHIAHRTGIEADVVAAVLKEFISW